MGCPLGAVLRAVGAGRSSDGSCDAWRAGPQMCESRSANVRLVLRESAGRCSQTCELSGVIESFGGSESLAKLPSEQVVRASILVPACQNASVNSLKRCRWDTSCAYRRWLGTSSPSRDHRGRR